MKNRLFIFLSIICCLAVSCSEKKGSSLRSLRLAVPGMDATPIEMLVGETYFVPIVADPEDFDHSSLVITTSEEWVATMNQYFIITAHNPGQAVITVGNGTTTFFALTVNVTKEYINNFKLSTNELTLYPGQTGEIEILNIDPETLTASCLEWDILPAGCPFEGSLEGNTMTITAYSDGEIGSIGQIYFTNGKEEGYVERSCVLKLVAEPEPVIEPVPVDLGLDVYWADINLGAKTETEAGNFYMWSDPTPRTSFTNKKDNKWMNSNGSWTKYIYPTDPYLQTQPDDDAATITLGNGWRTPTEYDYVKLFSNQNAGWTVEVKTTVTWTYKTVNGKKVYGYQITGKSVKNSIFLPATGFYDQENGSGEFKNGSTEGCYWTKNKPSAWTEDGLMMSMESGSYGTVSRHRSCGAVIRAVKDKN